MSPTPAPLWSVEPRHDGEGRSVLGTWPAIAAGVAAWLVYTAIYAFVFTLSGLPAGTAIRGAIANSVPDGVLALAVIAMTRRLAWSAERDARFPVAYAGLISVFALLAGVLKTVLIWADVRLIRGGGTFRVDGAILTWQVFISLLTCAAVAGGSYAQSTVRRLGLAAEAAERAQALRVRAELDALRAQLNPHFLFNVLHSVLGLVRRDPALAEEALERLGDLLRYAQHVHRDGIDWKPLRDEWGFMVSYLDLEKIRLGERLRVSLEADPAALDRLVPTFLLQPLVENAVRHGIAPRAGGGSLRVRAHADGTSLKLQVDNDGERGGEDGEPDEPGLGLRLLRERMAGLYGGRATVSSGPVAEGGFSVVLVLPEDAEDDDGAGPGGAVREGIE